MSISRKSLPGIIKLFCVVLACLAWVLSVSSAYASHTGVPPSITEVLINGQLPGDISCENPLTTGLVSVTGFGVGSAPPGKVEQYDVSIDWGDASPVVSTQAKFTPPSGSHKDFVFEFGDDPPFLPGDNPPVEHVYAAGNYEIIITLFHSEKSGNDSTIDSMLVFDICIFNPLDAFVQIDTVNGEAPDPLSCIPDPVTFAGSGQGAAPPLTINDYAVRLFFEDGTSELADAIFTPIVDDPQNFTFTFESAPQVFGENGLQTVTAALVSLPEGDPPLDTDSVEICVFTPVTPTLQFDSVNGQDPATLSCESPFTGPITIAGSGVAPATADTASVESHAVIISWGDNSTDTISPTSNPSSGIDVNFEYDFLFEHTYTFDGAFDVSVSLLYLDESGIQIVVTDTLEICVLLPRGTVTGAVTELTSGSSLIGATVSDVTNAPASLGSFPNFGDNNFVIDALPGLRTIRVEAQGFDPVDHQVMVTVGETSTQDFQLSFLQSDVNIFLLTIPIGDKPGGGASQVTMLPAWIEALFKGVVVQTSSVRVEFSYVFINLPIGKILFRAESSFYDVGEKRATNGTVKRAGNNRDNAQIKNIKIPADVPEARAPAITGTIQGVVDDGVSPVRALVSASFDFDGEPVVDGIDSDPATGIYVIPLVPSGAATVVADDNSNRSLVVPTTVVGGEVVTENLTVFPFDAENANFAPFVLNGPNINIAEEGNHSFSIDDFSVTDLDDTFSIDHTFLFHSGFGYTLSEVLSDSTRVTASLDFNGVLHIPVTFSDGISTSAPFDLTINVSPTVDPIVFVDFDTGEPAPGGTGGVDNPLLSIVDALPAVSAGGTILISGITPSSESPLVIDQAVTLQNNNPGPEPVIIDPNFVPLVRSLPETGFVTREGRPRVER